MNIIENQVKQTIQPEHAAQALQACHNLSAEANSKPWKNENQPLTATNDYLSKHGSKPADKAKLDKQICLEEWIGHMPHLMQ